MADTTERRRYRALAFSGGGFDTIMQLGVAHALLVTRGRAPDTIIGISAGAINATAVAEILQAGTGPDVKNDEERRAIQCDRLREFINAYCEVPRTIAEAIVPDGLEVIARSPLKPLESPLHFQRERDDRERANEAKAGLIDLINDVFRLRLPFDTITILVRRILGRIEAREKPRWRERFTETVANELRILGMAWRYIVHFAPVVFGLVWRAFRGERTRERRRKKTRKFTAGRLILKRKLARTTVAAVRIVLQVALFLPILAFLTASWALLYVPWQLVGAAIPKKKHGGGGDGADALVDRILGYYGLRDGLGNSDVLRQQLVRCFDQHYYGNVRIDEVLTRALNHDPKPAAGTDATPKRVGDYAAGKKTPPIDVAPVAANVATGALEVLPSDAAVVDALMAATAAAPLFPAIQIRKGNTRAWYIDGLNISNQPIGPLLEHLRTRLKQDPQTPYEVVDVYPVVALPVSRGELPCDRQDAGVLSVARRAMRLKRLQDATLEQRMTELYTMHMRENKAVVTTGDGDDQVDYVRANVIPIELDTPPEINRKVMLNVEREKLNEVMLETVAEGCRAAMEALIPNELKNVVRETEDRLAAREALEPWKLDFPPVRTKNAAETGNAEDESGNGNKKLQASICTVAMYSRFDRKHLALPGVPDSSPHPGLKEVCAKCKFAQSVIADDDWKEIKNRVEARHAKKLPDWPSETMPDPPARQAKTHRDKKSPLTGKLDTEQPTVSMLFGGGVFRGVFHMGVVNALSELRLMPNIVAGSSVGSIVAAMIAQVFTLQDVNTRKAQIARLAATFLAIDKLILTDRLADFIRRITLRASEMHFSLYDLDRVFRRFDADPTLAFADRARKVAAGFERMLYVSPFELRSLTQKYREERLMQFKREIQQDLQEFLNRSGIGTEILGSEPLRTLIEHHVLRPLQKEDEDLRDVPLARFLHPPPADGRPRRSVHFFATATDMVQGRLRPLSVHDKETPSLLFSLLASSAFPAVFRPRSAWEVMRIPPDTHSYIDGGVIDNLPLDAVAYFLNEALQGKARRPGVPHLLFTATLEVDKHCYEDNAWQVELTRRSCRRLSKRAASFRYNLKIDAYARVQRDVRRLYGKYEQYWADHPTKRAPLDLHVIAAKPQWLCGTFAFHPMLGFQRRKQAASIAHGCASTLGALYADWKHPESKFPGAKPSQWVETWLGTDGTIEIAKIDEKAIVVTYERSDPGFSGEGRYCAPQVVLEPNHKEKKAGECWFRKDVPCPFSADAIDRLTSIAGEEKKAMLRELPKIYQACGLAENHRGAEE